jgi:hypothetical protein
MNRPRRSLAIRDQAVSAFSGALMRLCDATCSPGAAFVDSEGETVDYAGCLEPYEIRVVAAELRLVLAVLVEQRTLAASGAEILYRGTKRSFAVFAMSDGYALVVESPRTSLGLSFRAVSEALRALAQEAGLPLCSSIANTRERWNRVEVKWDAQKRRPAHIWLGGTWKPLEVFGRFRESEPGNRTMGFRARTVDGSELTLVREPLGIWYVDDLPTPA